MNALLTFHNIQLNFKPVRIITNHPFLFPTQERWIPLFSWKSKANCHVFFTRAVNTAFPCTTTHTHTENCVRTNIITYNRFFWDISGFKTVIPWKAWHSCNRNSSIPCLSEAKFWKTKLWKETQDDRGDYFVPVKKHWWGPSLPPPMFPTS